MARYLWHCPRRDTLTSSRAIKSVRLTFVPPRCVATGRNGDEKPGADDLKKSSGTTAPGEKSYRRFTSLTRVRPTGRRERELRAPSISRARNTWLLLKIENFYRRTRVKLESESDMIKTRRNGGSPGGQPATTINNLNILVGIARAD